MLPFNDIKFLCKMNVIVYSNEDDIKNHYKKDDKISNLEFFDVSETGGQCMVCLYEKKTIVICIRGSSEIIDWYKNFKATRTELKKTDDSDMLVHSGFYNTFKSLQPLIFNHVQEIMKKEEIENIIYTGHSAGGSEAQICLTQLATMYPKSKHTCLTFGSPRVGNKSFVETFHSLCSESLQFVNLYDPVPHLPLKLRFKNTDTWYHMKHKNLIRTKKINMCCRINKDAILQHFPEEYYDAVCLLEELFHF